MPKVRLVAFIARALAVAHAGGFVPSTSPAAGPQTQLPMRPRWNLPPEAGMAIARALGRSLPPYHAKTSASGDRVVAQNERHGLQAIFHGDEVQVILGGDRLVLRRPSCRHRGLSSEEPHQAHANPRVDGNYLEFRCGTVTEWWVNSPIGLQQGFTITGPAGADRAGEPLRVELQYAGTLQPVVQADRRSLLWRRAGAKPVLAYRGLTAWDARGLGLPAQLEVAEGKLTIEVDHREAAYPITIDPWVQKAKLTASDGAESDFFGTAAAVSGDVIVVGAPKPFSGSAGRAYVFVKPSSGWADMTESATLNPSDGGVGDRFGDSVAIDGNVIVVGAPTHDTSGNLNRGAAYVFVKPAAGWAGTISQNAKLIAGDGQAGDWFGGSVGISGDVVVVGAPLSFSNDKGAAYVFVKPATGWVGTLTQTAKLVASDGAEDDELGTSVAISGDQVVAGAPFVDLSACSDTGKAYVFVKPTSGWAGTLNQTATLRQATCHTDDWFGVAVAISGGTVVVGASNVSLSTGGTGMAYVYVQPSGGWTPSGSFFESAALTASDSQTVFSFGTSVGIFSDTVVVGASAADVGANSAQGALYVFGKPGGGWVGLLSETVKLLATDGAAFDGLGRAVGIDGSTIVGGAPGDDINPEDQGSAYVFAFETAQEASPTPTEPTPTALTSTPSLTPTLSGTVSPTPSATEALTVTATETPSPTPTDSPTPIFTPTETPTPSPTNTTTPSTTATVTPTRTPTNTTTPSTTPTVTPTLSLFENQAGDFACSDGFDNDGNGLVDCADRSCATSTRCVAPVSVGQDRWMGLLVAMLGLLGLGALLRSRGRTSTR